MVKKPVLLIFVFAIFLPTANATATPQPATLFYECRQVIAKATVNQQVDKATDFYKTRCRRLDEKTAMSFLDSLTYLSRAIENNALEAAVFIMRADYYSVNNGYNNKSVYYHQQAIDYASTHNMPVEYAVYLHKKGVFYFTFNRNIKACQCFVQAYDEFKKLGLGNLPDISRYLAEQGFFYYALKDYDSAYPLLKQALNYPEKNVRTRINIITAIGLIYRGRHQYQQAIGYFDQALKIATAAKDSIWIGITTGNIGSVYFMQGDFKKAIPKLIFDYKTSLKFDEPANAAIALLRLSSIDLSTNAYNVAARRIDSAAALITGIKQDVLGTYIEIYKQQAILNQKRGLYKAALQYNEKYETARDSLARRDNIAAVERVKLKWETEKYRNQLNEVKITADVGAFKRNAVIAILFLMMVIFALLFSRYRLNAKKDQELLMIRKKRVDEKLKNAAEALKAYTETLKQNHLLIEKFKAEIEQFNQQSFNQNEKERLEKLLQAHIMTNESWDEFKRLFTLVHGSFFQKLREKYPTLTQTDMRLLSLIKLELNNMEMANMLGVTTEGIKKAKQRLRKKMQITADSSLEQTLVHF